MPNPSRQRRSRHEKTVQFSTFVLPEVRERIKILAQTAQVPQWAIIEAAIRFGEENGNVIPPEWDVRFPNGDPLPIDGLEEKSA